VAVEREGLRRWLSGRDADMREYAEARRRGDELTAVFDAARARLEQLYKQAHAPEEMRRLKAEEMKALKAALAAFPPFAAVEPNNALIAARNAYTRLVPEFEKLLAEEGGDLARFYARVKKLAASAPSSRGPLSSQSR
jgi:predicted aminopeptidase